MKKTPLYTLCACAVLAGSAQAVVIASYDFAGGSLVATTQQFGTAGDATLGGAFSTADGAALVDIGTGSINTDGLLYTAANGGQGTDAVTNQVVFTFTVAGLGAGDALQIDSLSADFDGTGVGTNTYRFNARFDAAGGANPQDSFRAAGQFDPGASGTYLEPIATGSAAEAGTRALVNGDTFSVSFGVRENQAQNSAYDNITLNATVVPIPEPSSTALLGFGFAGLMMRRRRG